jgi:hypothetical protein
LADPAFRLSVNFYGAPALSLKEFSSYEQDLIVGGSLQVSVPAGQYDNTRLINIGSNRWYFKPEIGFSKALGLWTLEAQAAVTLFTTNDDFFNGNRRAQKPLYSLQGHAIYSFPYGILGIGGRDLLRRRPHDVERNPRCQPAAELARGRYARHSRRRLQLDQVLREYRLVRPHRQQLRPHWNRVAVSVGRRTLEPSAVRRALRALAATKSCPFDLTQSC